MGNFRADAVHCLSHVTEKDIFYLIFRKVNRSFDMRDLFEKCPTHRLDHIRKAPGQMSRSNLERSICLRIDDIHDSRCLREIEPAI